MYLSEGPYDSRDAENAGEIAETRHKNGIYSLTRILQFNTEFVNLYELIKSRSLHLNQIGIWTSSCKY